MADFLKNWIDRDMSQSIPGTPIDAAHLGRFAPSVTSVEPQYLQPSGQNGFKVTADFYAKIIDSDSVHQIYGISSDLTVASAASLLDTGDALQAGKDYYVYLCEASGGAELVVSLNATYPAGYTAQNSRKIGGFHTLCAAAGTISGHPLSGYAAGAILPLSFWTLLHRPVSEPEGMVWISGIGKWVDIYLNSVSSGKLVSVYGGTIADGASATKFNGEKFVEWLGQVGKRPLYRNEFMVAAKGSNEETNIAGSADPDTAGGHTDTGGRRMISSYGLEDCCGVLWQWGADLYESYNGKGTSWKTTGNSETYTEGSMKYNLDGYSWKKESVYHPDFDAQSYGSCNGLLRRVLLGGPWDGGSLCGSRCAYCSYFSSYGWTNRAVRGAAEPRAVNL